MDLISEFYDGYRSFGIWSSPQRYGKQYEVYNRDDVVKLLKIWNGMMNCGISMCTFKGEVPFLLYLPFDFDSDSLDKSWYDAKRFYNYVADEGWDITINYSGFRGFHCLITVVPDYYSHGQIKSAQEFYKRILNLNTCDSQIFGDIRRLIRIPGSCHAGKFKKIKGKGWKRIGEGGYCYTIEHSKGEAMNLDEIFEDEYPDYDFDEVSSTDKMRHPFPCIDIAMDNVEPPQLIRYSYVAYHLKMGKHPDEILDMLEDRHSEGKEYEWDDWNKDYTRNQIYHIAGNSNYNPLRCATIKSLGYCLGSSCEYCHDDWKLKSVREMV